LASSARHAAAAALPPPPDGAKPVADLCPACARQHTLRIVERMIADRPAGSYSLAGVQHKDAARPGVVLECRAYGASMPGRIDPAAMTPPTQRSEVDHGHR
jgi:hypothetical protein